MRGMAQFEDPGIAAICNLSSWWAFWGSTSCCGARRIQLADKGFAVKELKKLTESLGLLRPDRKDETYRNGNLGGVRRGGSGLGLCSS